MAPSRERTMNILAQRQHPVNRGPANICELMETLCASCDCAGRDCKKRRRHFGILCFRFQEAWTLNIVGITALENDPIYAQVTTFEFPFLRLTLRPKGLRREAPRARSLPQLARRVAIPSWSRNSRIFNPTAAKRA